MAFLANGILATTQEDFAQPGRLNHVFAYRNLMTEEMAGNG